MMASDFALPMRGLFTRAWWLILMKGIVAILFGILALSRPHITLAALVMLFGAYALVDGLFSLGAALSGWRHREDRWLLLLEAFLGIGAGIVTLQAPGITTIALIFFIAAWALATGILKIVGAIRLRKEIKGEIWLILSGVAGVVFAFLVMERPAAGALAMVWVIGWYAIITGALLTMLSFKLRSLRRPQIPEAISQGPTRRAA
jgi:uncharacterized membrane protein HdeD (DUF308 family)